MIWASATSPPASGSRLEDSATLGASGRSITLVFIAWGVLIGLVGTVVGPVLGVTIGMVQDR